MGGDTACDGGEQRQSGVVLLSSAWREKWDFARPRPRACRRAAGLACEKPDKSDAPSPRMHAPCCRTLPTCSYQRWAPINPSILDLSISIHFLRTAVHIPCHLYTTGPAARAVPGGKNKKTRACPALHKASAPTRTLKHTRGGERAPAPSTVANSINSRWSPAHRRRHRQPTLYPMRHAICVFSIATSI